MSFSLSSISLQAVLKATIQNSIDGTSGTAKVALGASESPATTFSSGTGSSQADRIWQSTSRPLASGTNETINVYSFAGIDIGSGAGNGPLGGAMALLEICGLLIHNQAGSAGSITIGGQGTANAWTSWLNANTSTVGPIKPDGVFMIFEPAQPAWLVGAASNNLLEIAASGGAVLYDIFILGRQ